MTSNDIRLQINELTRRLWLLGDIEQLEIVKSYAEACIQDIEAKRP